MLRVTFCSLALLGFSSAAMAGELDKESAPAKAARVGFSGSVGTGSPSARDANSTALVGSELDKESPRDAQHHHGGWSNYGHHHGYGGYGYGNSFSYGRSYGYGGYGGYSGYSVGYSYRPIYNSYPVGFGGYSYSGFYGYPAYSTYYSSFGYYGGPRFCR